jgi:hypothetical protein
MRRLASAFVLLCAFLALPLSAAKPSDEALSVLPSDAASVGLVRVADLRTSPLFDRVFHEADRVSCDAEAARFLAETGLDPKRDVDVVAFAGSPGRGGSGWALVAFEGRFDAARLAAAAVERGAVKKTTADGDVYLLAGKKHVDLAHEPGAIAFLSNRLVVAGNETAVAQALARRASGGKGFSAGEGLGRQMSRVGPGSSAWVLIDMSRVPMRDRAAAGHAEGPAAAVVSAMKTVSFATLSVTAEGDALKLSATGVSGDPETRQDLEDAVRGVLAVWRLAVQERHPDLVSVLRKFKVSHEGDGVTLSGTLPGPVIREMAERKKVSER